MTQASCFMFADLPLVGAASTYSDQAEALVRQRMRASATSRSMSLSEKWVHFSGTCSSPAPKGLDDRRLQRVCEFVEGHLEDHITIERLAAAACLSPFHFARSFKTATGQSPHQYVNEARMRFAKMLLARGEESLVDVALSCGFSSQANFSKAFRRAIGMAPGQYRAAYAAPRRQFDRGGLTPAAAAICGL